MERLPETPPEADLECQHYRTFCESGTRSDGTNGFTGIRRNLPLLQRGRYSVILDKETDVRFRSPQRSVAHSFGSGEFGRQLFLRPPRFERGEETEGTASEGFPTQGEAVPPRWAERPAIPARAQPFGLNDATSDIAQWRLPTSTASSIAAKTPNESSEYRPRNGWRRTRFRKEVRTSSPEDTSLPLPRMDLFGGRKARRGPPYGASRGFPEGGLWPSLVPDRHMGRIRLGESGRSGIRPLRGNG